MGAVVSNAMPLPWRRNAYLQQLRRNALSSREKRERRMWARFYVEAKRRFLLAEMGL